MEVKEKRRNIVASHTNAHLIILGIVYHLSATLNKGNIHDHLGQKKEMQLIQFLCRYGYTTRKGTTLMLHVTNTHYCGNINDTKFLQGCFGYYRILPVALFLAMIFNAYLTYQEDKSTNLLISVLNCETFMMALGTNTRFVLNSKLEFHTKY